MDNEGLKKKKKPKVSNNKHLVKYPTYKKSGILK